MNTSRSKNVITLEKAPNPEIRRYLENHYDDILTDLECLTNIDSPTGHLAGVIAIQKWFEKQFRLLGAAIETRESKNGPHLIARLKGQGKAKTLLIAHVDTVLSTNAIVRDIKEWEALPYREGDAFAFRYVAAKKHAHGPGVGDCKASALLLLWLARACFANEYKPFGELLIWLDSEEEVMGEEGGGILDELGKKADHTVVCDTGRPNWGIVTRRKAMQNFSVTVRGISGHAGNGPHCAASAIDEICDFIARVKRMASKTPYPLEYFSRERFQQRGEIDCGQHIPEISINVPMIGTTNTKFNVIPDYAEALLHVRAFEPDDIKRLYKRLAEFAREPLLSECKITVAEASGMSPPLKSDDPGSRRLHDLYVAVANDEYAAVVTDWRGGGLTRANGRQNILDCAGVDTDPAYEHSTREYVDLNSFVPRAVCLSRLLAEIA